MTHAYSNLADMVTTEKLKKLIAEKFPLAEIGCVYISERGTVIAEYMLNGKRHLYWCDYENPKKERN